MFMEIERRFIVDVDKLQRSLQAAETLKIIQAYFETPVGTPTTRVRAVGTNTMNRGYQTTKIKTAPGVHREYEYEIPFSDALDIIAALNLKVQKTRKNYFWTNSDGVPFMFEVDFFDGFDVVIAEVELESKEALTEIPDWCVREITDETGISNYDMAARWDHACAKLRKLADEA